MTSEVIKGHIRFKNPLFYNFTFQHYEDTKSNFIKTLNEVARFI